MVQLKLKKTGGHYYDCCFCVYDNEGEEGGIEENCEDEIAFLSVSLFVSIFSAIASLDGNMGFTLPENMGDLDPAIECLDLSKCSLTGLH